jgi:diketogulonate reductase-like aldo/keto reductase
MDDRSLGRGRISVPVVGLGTWRRLEAAAAAGRHRELIGTAVTAGIRLFDTSPMYGDAERLLAGALDGRRDEVFIADKIWTPSAQEGAAQLARAVDWYGGRVDLMQIHNLVSWPAHLTMLQAARDRGQVGLIGATHYSPVAFGELAELMRSGQVDVQTGPARGRAHYLAAGGRPRPGRAADAPVRRRGPDAPAARPGRAGAAAPVRGHHLGAGPDQVGA